MGLLRISDDGENYVFSTHIDNLNRKFSIYNYKIQMNFISKKEIVDFIGSPKKFIVTYI